MGTRSKTSEFEQKKIAHNKHWTLMLHNDDVNTFDHVIESLVDVCDHDVYQAEQCALITHYKGKCDVKHGKLIKLEPMLNELHRRGLSATVNQN